MERDIPHPVADAPGASELRAHWWESLRTRLLLWSTLTSTLLLVGVTALFYLGIRAVLIDDARGQMHSLAEQTTKGLNSTMDSAQHVARTLAASITSIGVEHDNLRALLRASVHADADISGATLIIEPGVLAPDDPGFNFHIRRKDGGYEEEAIEDDDLDYDYRQTPRFIRTTTSSMPWWSEPHIDDLSGDVLVTTYNLALRRDGESATAAGMVSVDVPIAQLRPSLAGIPASRNIRAVLLSPERLLVLHPDPQLEMKQSLDELVLEKGRGDLAPMLEALRQHKSVEFRHEAPPSQDAPDGETRYSFAIPVNGTGWAFALSVSQNYVLARLHRITMWVGLAALLAVLLSVLVARRFSNLIAQPIEDLTGTARHFARGEFDYTLPHVERLDEVGVMARAFESARDSIKRQLTEITELGAARARAESELDIARDIQLAMLPSGNELDVGESHLDMDGLLEPAKAVGGDFYSFFEREGYALWFVIGDVSDKGVPAALFMARTTTVLGVAAQLGGSPGHALMEAARHLVEGNETCMFATVLCGVIELRTGALSLASAGHEAPILLRADGRRQLLPVPTAPPLGMDVAGDYPIWRGRMMPGDTLFTFTDGITEAFNRDNEPFGIERLLDSLDPDLDARRQCQKVVARVHEFAGDTAQSDDITALAIRYRRDTHGRERSSARIALRTPLPADPVGHMIAQVDATLAERHLPAETMDDVHLVVEEIVTNIVNHGTDERRDLVLALELAADAQRLTLEFHDNCRPFDPTSLPAPDLDADIADRPLGGLGVSLVRSLAEQFVYARINNKNVLRVVLPVPSPKDST